MPKSGTKTHNRSKVWVPQTHPRKFSGEITKSDTGNSNKAVKNVSMYEQILAGSPE